MTARADASGPSVLALVAAIAALAVIGPDAAPGAAADDDAQPRSDRPSRYGITMVTPDEPRTGHAAYARANGGLPSQLVVLVHGLDDPGWMWRDVAAALLDAGFAVARLDYPNDGPIADAADLFALELARLKAGGVEQVDVVAHSMGGLVTRDVLTRRAYYGGDGTGGERLPAIRRLIMCGTPNHGSNMARLRAVSEIKEQISRAFSGDGSLMGGVGDGSGEAAIDLLPESEFLRRLNDRPPPTYTAYAIIAGRMSPVSEEKLQELGGAVRDAARKAGAPAWLRDALRKADTEANALLRSAVRGLGDGCVTIDSARLAGVDDFVVVEANHLSMIVHLPGSPTPPPAIPVILRLLGAGDDAAAAPDEPNVR